MSKWERLAKSTPDPAIRHLINDTLRIAKESDAAEAIVESLEKGLHLAEKRQEFGDNTTSEGSKLCSNIQVETWSHDWVKVYEEGKTKWNLTPFMISTNVSGQLLKSIVSATKAKTILEVGMFTGYTAVSMAEALPSDGKIVTLDQDEYLKTFVQSLMEESPHKNKVEIIIGNALDEMQAMSSDGKSFDIVFLDASKAEYEAYVKLCIDGNLLAPNGTIIVDNAYLGGDSYLQPDSCGAAFAEVIRKDPALHVVLIPIKDGIFLIRRQSDVDKVDA